MDKEKNRDEKATSFDADSIRIFYEFRYKNNIKSSQNQAHLTTFFILKNQYSYFLQIKYSKTAKIKHK